jgi:hypothetical protein
MQNFCILSYREFGGSESELFKSIPRIEFSYHVIILGSHFGNLGNGLAPGPDSEELALREYDPSRAIVGPFNSETVNAKIHRGPGQPRRPTGVERL